MEEEGERDWARMSCRGSSRGEEQGWRPSEYWRRKKTVVTHLHSLDGRASSCRTQRWSAAGLFMTLEVM